MTIGLHFQADAGRSEQEMYDAMIASHARTHVVLNGPGLAACGVTAGKRIIYRRWMKETTTRNRQSDGDNNADETYDPVDFVNRIHAAAPAGCYVALGNEMWCSTPGQIKRMNDWTVTALWRCNALGRKAGIFSVSVGNPPDPALWHHARPALQLAKDGGHLLLLHEYWGAKKDTDATSGNNKPWLIGRYDLIPAGLPRPEICIAELGLAYDLKADQGYVGRMSDEEYARELIKVSRLYHAEGIDSCVFVYGPKGGQWASFVPSERVLTLVAAYNRIAANQQRPPEPTPTAWYWHRPVRAPFVVTSPFGSRPTPEHNDGDATELHWGTDYTAADWTAYAAREGTVVIAGADNTGFGNLVKLDHGGGYTSLYGHLESISVRVGDRVSAGQKVGVIGSTGRSTARHLHFESRKNNVPYAPAPEMKPHPLDASPPIPEPPVDDEDTATLPPVDPEPDYEALYHELLVENAALRLRIHNAVGNVRYLAQEAEKAILQLEGVEG